MKTVLINITKGCSVLTLKLIQPNLIMVLLLTFFLLIFMFNHIQRLKWIAAWSHSDKILQSHVFFFFSIRLVPLLSQVMTFFGPLTFKRMIEDNILAMLAHEQR